MNWIPLGTIALPTPDYDKREYQKLHLERSIWQAKQLGRFVDDLYREVMIALQFGPIKIPSGKYTEQMKVERTQADLVNEMAKELSDLPRFTAYTKLIEGESAIIHKIKTEPFYKGISDAHIQDSLCYTRRDIVKQAIAQRLEDSKQRPGRYEPPPTHA
jgi:hypothetical protein